MYARARTKAEVSVWPFLLRLFPKITTPPIVLVCTFSPFSCPIPFPSAPLSVVFPTFLPLFEKKVRETFGGMEKSPYLCTRKREEYTPAAQGL